MAPGGAPAARTNDGAGARRRRRPPPRAPRMRGRGRGRVGVLAGAGEQAAGGERGCVRGGPAGPGRGDRERSKRFPAGWRLGRGNRMIRGETPEEVGVPLGEGGGRAGRVPVRVPLSAGGGSGVPWGLGWGSRGCCGPRGGGRRRRAGHSRALPGLGGAGPAGRREAGGSRGGPPRAAG